MLNKSTLNNRISIMIPSIEKTGVMIDDTKREKYINTTSKMLCKLFGGSTSYKCNGRWILQNGKMQVENIDVVYSAYDIIDNSKENKILKLITKLKKDLNQETIAVDITSNSNLSFY